MKWLLDKLSLLDDISIFPTEEYLVYFDGEVLGFTDPVAISLETELKPDINIDPGSITVTLTQHSPGFLEFSKYLYEMSKR